MPADNRLGAYRGAHSRQVSLDSGHAAPHQSLSGKPLIYNVAWKTLIYTLVSVLIHYLEHLYDFAKRPAGSLQECKTSRRNRLAAFLGGQIILISLITDVLHDA